MGIRETWDPGTGEPIIPEFTATGTDGITALTFEPDTWPRADGDDDRGTVMKVEHLMSGLSRSIVLPRESALADWFADGMRELVIHGAHRTHARLEWTGGYVQVQCGENKNFRTTVDPWHVTRISQFLLSIRRNGWTEWNTRQGR